jgi:Pyrimidine dimer DNA glycosylase
MRLWSIHPTYLDAKGLVAVWREGLLALAVIRGNTVGYRNHPQLTRFAKQQHPVEAMKCYLQNIFKESTLRGYHFDSAKIGRAGTCNKISVTKGQLQYEMNHLLQKLKIRDPARYRQLKGVEQVAANPVFRVVEGSVEGWEKI